MSNYNKHIKDYLDYYVKKDLNFEYAVLIKGKWGSGKTFFIKEYIEEFRSGEDNTKEEILYISLNGLERLDDIYKLIIESKFSITRKTKILFGMLKVINSIAETTKINIKEIKKQFKSDLLIIGKNTILVFDDIERISKNILISDLLGFVFREFIEKNNAKVILIYDEEKITKNKEFEEENKDYFSVKEKTIGKTFEVQTNINQAFDNFIKDIGDNCQKLLNKNRNIILEIHNRSKYNNLRLLKQTIYDFDRLYLEMSLIKEYEIFLTNFLIIFFIYSIEYKKGNFKEYFKEKFNDFYLTDNEKEKKFFELAKQLYSEPNKKDNSEREESINDKYNILLINKIKNFDINWEYILSKGYFDSASIFIRNEKSEFLVYKKIIQPFSYNYDDEIFQKYFTETIKILENYKIIDPYDFIKLISFFNSCINNKVKLVINKFEDNKNLLRESKRYIQNTDFTYDNKQMAEIKRLNTFNEKDEFLKEIISNLYKNKKFKNEDIKKIEFNNIILNLTTVNIIKFRDILLPYNNENDVAKFPILNIINNIDYFVEEIFKLTFTEIKEILDYIDERILQYRFKEELDFLKFFLEILEKKVKLLEGKISYMLIKNCFEKLKKNLNYFPAS